MAQPPTKTATPVLRAGFTEVLRDGDADQVDQGQAEADRDGREALRGALVGGAEDDHEEHHRHDDLGDQAGGQRVAAGRMGAVAVGGEARRRRRSRPCRSRSRRECRPPRSPPGPGRRCRAASCPAGKRPPAQRPTETAGLRWQPEMWPMAKAIVSTVSPKASDTPRRPIPTRETPRPARRSRSPRGRARTFRRTRRRSSSSIPPLERDRWDISVSPTRAGLS